MVSLKYPARRLHFTCDQRCVPSAEPAGVRSALSHHRLFPSAATTVRHLQLPVLGRTSASLDPELKADDNIAPRQHTLNIKPLLAADQVKRRFWSLWDLERIKAAGKINEILVLPVGHEAFNVKASVM